MTALPEAALWTLPSLSPLAHCSWWWRWRTVAGFSWELPGRFQGDSFHRMQRRPRNLSLLCKQIQLLAHHHRPALPKQALGRHTQGRTHPKPYQQMSSLYEKLIEVSQYKEPPYHVVLILRSLLRWLDNWINHVGAFFNLLPQKLNGN